MIEHERGIVFPDTLTREAAAAIIERRFAARDRLTPKPSQAARDYRK